MSKIRSVVKLYSSVSFSSLFILSLHTWRTAIIFSKLWRMGKKNGIESRTEHSFDPHNIFYNSLWQMTDPSFSSISNLSSPSFIHRLCRSAKSKIDDRAFVSGHIVTAGKGISETRVYFSANETITGLFCHLVYTSFVTNMVPITDKIIVMIHQSLEMIYFLFRFNISAFIASAV